MSLLWFEGGQPWPTLCTVATREEGRRENSVEEDKEKFAVPQMKQIKKKIT